jgi:signal transduction histidine kinase
MVSDPHAPLTRIGFRRDVRLFLATLLGFLIVLIFTLLILLRADLDRTEETINRSRTVIADVAADAINATPHANLETQLVFLRSRYGVVAATIETSNGKVTSGTASGTVDEWTRVTRAGRLHLFFDGSDRRVAWRRFIFTALICLAAVSFGTVLLFSYLPRITRPIEEMLDDARSLGERAAGQDETAYLIETFRNSIATLKAQEEELTVLHGREKARADDLERVTAALTRSLTSGLIAVDATGKVMDINGAGREILRLEAPSSPRGTIEDAVPLAAFADSLRHAFEQQATMTRVEIEDRHANGDEVVIGLTSVPLRNEAGTFLGLLALFTDLTPIRSLEARVQEMTTLAQLGEIAAGIAHEFRSSMSTILGYMKLARRGTIDEVAEGRLQSAEKEASLLLQAIERLLSFARPIELHSEPVDLRDLFEEQIALLRDISPDVEFELSGPAVAIDGDRVLLTRAVENVLRNAVDAIHQKGEQGTVRVRLTDNPAPTAIITDDGIGFDPAETSRLFLPFHSNKPNGFGMGLPLAKKIVLLHGGTLRLQGEPGRGAVATMEFGVAQPVTA